MLEALPKHFLRDACLGQLSYAYYAVCVLAMACFLQTDISQQRMPRTAVGLLITASLLVVQPFIYYSPSQTWGIGLSSCCCLAAWSLLHWTFMEQLSSKPSLLSVCLSVVTHPMSGVIKVYQRMQPKRAPATKPSTGMQLRSGRPLVVVDAAGDMDLIQGPPAQGLLSTLFKSLVTMLAVCVSYDVGLYLLCAISNGMCLATGTPSSFLAVCVFGYIAGSLLPLQMDIMYCCMRSCMYACAFAWPALADYADQLPRHAFNWPGASSSISDLWGWRWHQFLRFYFQGLGYTTVDKLLPKGKAVSPGLCWTLHTVSAFFMSGIMHEYLTWAAFGTVTGFYMAFFGLHCAAILLETWGPFILKHAMQGMQHIKRGVSDASADITDQAPTAPSPARRRSSKASSGGGAAKKPVRIMPAWVLRCWTVVVMLLLSPLFVEPYRAAGYFAERAWHPFLGISVTERVVGWAQQHVHAQFGFAGIARAL